MANRYWVGGNATWDATAGTKWATTSGGAGGAAVPTSSDDVFLDNGAGTGNVTMGTGYTGACKSLNCTGYVGTLAGSGNITVTTGGTGNVTLAAGMTITCTGTLTITGTSTLTSNGKTWTGNLSFSGGTTPTITMADDWTVSGNITFTSNSLTLNSSTIYFGGNLTTTNNYLGGTTVLNHNANGGTWGGAAALRNTLVLNANFTISDGVTISSTSTTISLVYTSGTITWGGKIILGTVSIDATSLTFNNVELGNSSTVTLLNHVNISGNLSATANNTIVNGAYNINVSGDVDFSTMTTANVTGTATIVMVGTGSIKSPTTTGYIGVNVTLNTAGNITLTNNVYFGGGKTFLITAVGSLLSSSGVLHTRNTSATITNNVASLTFPFSIETDVATTFNGSYGFTVGSFTSNVAGVVNTFKAGNTYTVTTTLTLIGTLASRVEVKSDTASSYAIFTLSMGATQTVVYVSATDMDSSLGQTIWDAQGVLLRTLNWNLLTAPGTVGYITIS